MCLYKATFNIPHALVNFSLLEQGFNFNWSRTGYVMCQTECMLHKSLPDKKKAVHCAELSYKIMVKISPLVNAFLLCFFFCQGQKISFIFNLYLIFAFDLDCIFNVVCTPGQCPPTTNYRARQQSLSSETANLGKLLSFYSLWPQYMHCLYQS